ncbi:MAG: hypothetical protein ABIH83_03870 [Candidatus Micrarchaeota archaeon]
MKNPTHQVVLTSITLLTSTSILFSNNSVGAEYLQQALNDLCCDLQGLIPVSAMLLVVAAAVIYSIGQMFGSETRARANVWATSCLTGAVIGIIISQVAPHVLSIIAGPDVVITCSCT